MRLFHFLFLNLSIEASLIQTFLSADDKTQRCQSYIYITQTHN